MPRRPWNSIDWPITKYGLKSSTQRRLTFAPLEASIRTPPNTAPGYPDITSSDHLEADALPRPVPALSSWWFDARTFSHTFPDNPRDMQVVIVELQTLCRSAPDWQRLLTEALNHQQQLVARLAQPQPTLPAGQSMAQVLIGERPAPLWQPRDRGFQHREAGRPVQSHRPAPVPRSPGAHMPLNVGEIEDAAMAARPPSEPGTPWMFDYQLPEQELPPELAQLLTTDASPQIPGAVNNGWSAIPATGEASGNQGRSRPRSPVRTKSVARPRTQSLAQARVTGVIPRERSAVELPPRTSVMTYFIQEEHQRRSCRAIVEAQALPFIGNEGYTDLADYPVSSLKALSQKLELPKPQAWHDNAPLSTDPVYAFIILSILKGICREESGLTPADDDAFEVIKQEQLLRGYPLDGQALINVRKAMMLWRYQHNDFASRIPALKSSEITSLFNRRMPNITDFTNRLGWAYDQPRPSGGVALPATELHDWVNRLSTSILNLNWRQDAFNKALKQHFAGDELSSLLRSGHYKTIADRLAASDLSTEQSKLSMANPLVNFRDLGYRLKQLQDSGLNLADEKTLEELREVFPSISKDKRGVVPLLTPFKKMCLAWRYQNNNLEDGRIPLPTRAAIESWFPKNSRRSEANKVMQGLKQIYKQGQTA